MNAAVHDVSASGSRHPADAIAAQRISCVNADTDDIAGLDRVLLERVQRLVDQQRCSVTSRRRGGENVLPPRGDHGGAKRYIARIDQVNSHRYPLRTSRRRAGRTD